MNITVVGIGYVGLSNAILLAQHNKVIALDLDKDKVDKINQRISPLDDVDIADYLKNKDLDLVATCDAAFAYSNCDFVIVATPTDYDPVKNEFDTSSVDAVTKQITSMAADAHIVIKSTVPVGYTGELSKKTGANVMFSPEFLREGNALRDNLYPSRIVIGEKSERARLFGSLLQKGAKKKDIDVVFTNSTEAEAIKLFSNTYLAMRVSFFNELDSFAMHHGLSTKDIIEGVCLDSRIGEHYNNPSFGYGGYCLPKDTKQLLSNYKNIPQKMIQAIVESNDSRKDFLTLEILKRAPSIVGIHRLAMKVGSDNSRQSAIFGLIDRLVERGIEIIVYEPTITDHQTSKFSFSDNLKEFVDQSDVILANRLSNDLKDCEDKVFSRDMFGVD